MTRPRILGIVAYTIAFYLALTAFFGYRLGREIHAAKSNPYVGIASQILGTQATESFVVQQAGLPVLVTASPAFWLALRLTE
jgi:hypothetical protein